MAMRHATTRPEPAIAAGPLLLRTIEAGDLESLVAGANDYAVSSMLARVPFPYTLADAELFLAAVRDGAAAGRDLTLALTLAGRPVGCMGIADLGTESEFGYWLARAEWGKGLMSQAARAFLAHAFAAYDLVRVKAGAFADNPASLRIQEKLGFVQTGSGRRFSLARGRDVDHIDTLLTRQAFERAAS
jgi:RimJ/RimL family protein N-acetyltransferase